MPAGQSRFKQELEASETRPETASLPLWRRPLFKEAVKNMLVLAVGFGLGVVLPINVRVKA